LFDEAGGAEVAEEWRNDGTSLMCKLLYAGQFQVGVSACCNVVNCVWRFYFLLAMLIPEIN